MIRILVALWAAASAIEAAGGQLQPIRIGLVREASAGPLYIAVAAGYFRAEGLDPQVSFLQTDASVSAAVASGRVDIGLSSLSAPFYRYAAGHGLKMIASQASDQTGFPMVALLIGSKAYKAGFSDVRRLTGARIGIAQTEPGAYYALSSVASKFGVAFDSIKMVWSKSPRAELAALSRGEVDAALLPYATATQSAGKGDLLLRLSDLVVRQQGVVFTAGGTIATRRDLVERFMRAYQRGTADYQLNFQHYDDAGDFIPGPHTDAYLELIARQAHVSAGLLAMTKTYCDRRANLDVADIRKQVKFWQDRGRLDRGIAAADLLDLSFIGEERP
ncbi:MAG TPA: ABC transporter substrate-binding protein [Burkholderiaceae bacterium]|nr:ABC transporter substrate-binding protein [Burkholderiaceae bacterium]